MEYLNICLKGAHNVLIDEFEQTNIVYEVEIVGKKHTCYVYGKTIHHLSQS